MPRKNNTPLHQKFKLILSCTQKRAFTTEKLAQIAAETQMLQKPGLELRVYLCPDCHKWHLTRRT
jgi:acetone carboxylase gamma subunit